MLKVEDLSAGYGRMTVLRNLDLEVKPGEVTLILGPNGAGKSTLLSAISGLIPVQRGRVIVGDDDISAWKAERIARRGVRHVMEGHRIFPELTVEDNIRLGQISLPAARRRAERTILEEAFEVFPVLGEKRALEARNLSGGQQQMLALVQAWVSQPEFLFCDEPSLGLAMSLIPEILQVLRARADEGMGIVLVEQLIDQPLVVADRVVVLRQGEILASGAVSDFQDREALAALMLGTMIDR